MVLPLSFNTALSVARLPLRMEMWHPGGAMGEERGNTMSCGCVDMMIGE